MAFFTRFTEGFILIVTAYYLLINFNDFKKQLTRRNLLTFVGYVVVAGIIISAIYLAFMGNIPFISQFLEVSSSSQVSSVNVGYELNPFYYFQNLPEYLTSFCVSGWYFSSLSTSDNSPTLLSYVFILLVGLYILKFLSGLVKHDNKMNNEILKVLGIVMLSFFMIISYTHISYMFTEALFFIIMLLYYKWIPDKDNQMDYVMILWMGIYIIMHSYHPVKVDRYIIPIMVPFAYLLSASIQYLLKERKKS